MDEKLFDPEEKTEPDVNFATIDKIFSDGVTLLFDGEDTPSEKHYLVNSFAVFHPGDRVRVIKDSGTYVVEYSVGKPKVSFNADTADHADTASTAEKAGSADTADTANKANSAGTASSASTAGTADNAKTLNGKAESALSVSKAASATNVTNNINGKSISSIFESDGYKVKKATTADTATNATKLNNKAESNLSVSYAASAEKFTRMHSGTYLGFFGSSGSSKKSVQTAGSDGVTRQQLNALINALRGYGLIG